MDLEFAWQALDRAALWASSTEVAWPHTRRSLAATTCTMLLPVQASHLRAAAALGRAGINHVPSALAAGRATFELGLRAAWVYAPDSQPEQELRAVALHDSSARWKDKVGDRLESASGMDGSRWHDGAERHRSFVARHVPPEFMQSDVPNVPSAYAQLCELGLQRLYHGYQLASEYVHGGVASGGEIGAIREEGSPFGLYWPQDWTLSLNMCAWGCLFVSQHTCPKTKLVPPPIGELMMAAESLLDAPGRFSD
jgi:hypothetical protein